MLPESAGLPAPIDRPIITPEIAPKVRAFGASWTTPAGHPRAVMSLVRRHVVTLVTYSRSDGGNASGGELIWRNGNALD